MAQTPIYFDAQGRRRADRRTAGDEPVPQMRPGLEKDQQQAEQARRIEALEKIAAALKSENENIRAKVKQHGSAIIEGPFDGTLESGLTFQGQAVGPRGSDGSQGFQGPQGFQGFQGDFGGPQGPQGFQGFQGDQGSFGNTGPQGFQGEQGVQGFQGFQGNQGFQGDQGHQGDQGNQGPQGFQGDKLAIVTSTAGPVQLVCVEAPEVRFEDVVVVPMSSASGIHPIDPLFLEVCEPGSIEIVSICANFPTPCGGQVLGSNLMIVSAMATLGLRCVVKLSGIRKGRGGVRFTRRTEEEMRLNTSFWSSWNKPR